MDWQTLLASVTGAVDQHLLLRIEYLVVENGSLRDQITGRLHLNDAECRTLAELGKTLGKQDLETGAKVAKPDPILGWHRKLRRKSSMAPINVSPWGGPESIKSSRIWWYA